MSEEKNRNYKSMNHDATSSDSIPSFLLKTYEILENCKYSDIICWTKNGEGFVVKKVKEFAENVLPTHFRHSNYTSFVRQLNMYDFHKTRQQNQQNAFKNIMFKKGNKHLLKDIERKDYKKKKQNRQENLEKSVGLGYENQGNGIRSDKKTQYMKEFYEKNVSHLISMNERLQVSTTELAQVREINVENEKEICLLVDKLFTAKNTNKDLLLKLSQFSAEWESFCKVSRKMSIQKKQQDLFKKEDQKQVKIEPFTAPSFKSLQKK